MGSYCRGYEHAYFEGPVVRAENIMPYLSGENRGEFYLRDDCTRKRSHLGFRVPEIGRTSVRKGTPSEKGYG